MVVQKGEPCHSLNEAKKGGQTIKRGGVWPWEEEKRR